MALVLDLKREQFLRGKTNFSQLIMEHRSTASLGGLFIFQFAAIIGLRFINIFSIRVI